MELSKYLSSRKMTVTLSLVALNLIIGSLVSFFKIPIYLDSIGIVIATILLGFGYGIICSILTVSIGFFVINPYLPAYFGTSLAIVFTTHILRKNNFFSSYFRVLISGIILAIVSAVVSAPITAFLFGGATLSGSDILTIYFRSIGNNILKSVLFSGLSSEPIDKIIVTFSTFQILKSIPATFINKYNFNKYKN